MKHIALRSTKTIKTYSYTGFPLVGTIETTKQEGSAPSHRNILKLYVCGNFSCAFIFGDEIDAIDAFDMIGKAMSTCGGAPRAGTGDG